MLDKRVDLKMDFEATASLSIPTCILWADPHTYIGTERQINGPLHMPVKGGRSSRII